MSEIIRWSAARTVRHLKARDVSAVEVVQAHLDRLDAINPKLNAVVDMVPDALERARAIDTGTLPAGLLAGAPITTKINADQAGLATTNGVAAFANNIAPADSPLLHNLKEAGAVVIGRTNTPELSLRWCTSNPLHGMSLSPWGEQITPGGSSGAAAAAVASGIGVIAHGNDVGGSLRYPAYCCGLASLRPSRGRIPTYNPSAKSERPPVFDRMSVHGPIARTVEDVQLGLSAMRGFSADDPGWTSARAYGRERKRGPVRIGIAMDGFSMSPHAEVTAAMTRATEAARAAGCILTPVDLPNTARMSEIWGQLIFTEIAHFYATAVNEYISDDARRWVRDFSDHFGTLDLPGYMDALAERSLHQRAWAHMFDDLDAVLMPVSLQPPFANNLDFDAPDKAGWMIDAQAPLYVVNLIGLPALALPTHVADGVPSGVQLVGPMHDDDRVLSIGAMLERELGTVLGDIPQAFRL
ncbi:amidase [Roseovarius aestuarii]|nr:amidase [Roseovarius aestuarii]